MIQERENIGAGLKTLAYQYTPDSLLSQTTYPGGTVALRTYNTDRLLYQTKIDVGMGPVLQATFGYDTADRRSHRVYVNGVQTNWTLDANNRVTDLKHFVPGMTPVTLQEWNYGYSPGDDPLSQNDVTPSYTVHGQAYQYDGLHQIDAFQRGIVSGNTVPSPVASQAWTLSKAGDWTSWATTIGMTTTTDTRTHNNIHALTSRSVVANPQLYDSNSNQSDDGANYLFVYDANDQLQQVQNRTTMAVIATYRYDAFGRRVEKNLGSGTTVTQYYYAGQQIVEEHDDTGGVDSLTAFYTYGDYVDETLTMDRPSGTRHYYHANRLNSTYLLTDSMGAIAERYVYTPYGVATTFDSTYTTPQATSRVGNTYLFTGRELDDETLLYFYRARTYDPVQGRFKQLDPLGLSADSNLYRYVSNGPTSGVDSSGLVIIGNCEISDYLRKNGIFGFSQTPGLEGDWTYSAGDNTAMTRAGNTLTAEILYDMLATSRRFVVKDGTVANLVLHVDTRTDIVNAAKTVKFKFGDPDLGNAQGAPLTVGQDALGQPALAFTKPADQALGYLWRPTGSQLSCGCSLGAALVMEQGISTEVDVNKIISNNPEGNYTSLVHSDIVSTTVDGTNDWVPGDAGFITNNKGGHIPPSNKGQNIIYLGQQLYWGLGPASYTPATMATWIARVSTYIGNGNAAPTVRGSRDGPKVGLSY